MGGFRDRLRLSGLAARLLAGRRFWLTMLVPLAWTAFHAWRIRMGWREAFEPVDVQNFLVGVPLVVLAVFLGVRVIAGEVDARRLEIAYTVPGGSQRVWTAKLLAAWWILIVAELLLALATYTFFLSFPPSALYGALQSATFYLVLSMGLAAIFKSEVTGAMVSIVAVLAGMFLAGAQPRFSPFWNPLTQPDADASQLLGWSLQNRIGYALLITAFAALAFGRAESREKMLAG